MHLYGLHDYPNCRQFRESNFAYNILVPWIPQVLLTKEFLIRIDIFLQCLLVYVMNNVDKEYRIGHILAANPLMMINTFMHPLSTLRLLRLAFLLLAYKTKSKYLLLAMGIAVFYLDPLSVCLLPFLSDRQLTVHQLTVTVTMFLGFITAAETMTIIYSQDSGILSQHAQLSKKIVSYEPNLLNVWWYLKAEVFMEFSTYMSCLSRIQPIIYVLLIYHIDMMELRMACVS